jgi:hypothetical protein
MAEQNYQDAVQALQRHFAGRWEGTESDGRHEMEEVLKNELNYTSSQAHDAIDALVAAGSVRYVTDSVAEVALGDAPNLPAPAAPMGTGGSGGIVAEPTSMVPGYWQITGGGVVESEARKGQVEPT